VFVVDEGTLEVTINGNAEKCGPKTFVFISSNDEHTMKNIGTSPATYHVLRIVTDLTPKPAGPALPTNPAPPAPKAA
jgi:quercetin dioxygenase-like cupin family protein